MNDEDIDLFLGWVVWFMLEERAELTMTPHYCTCTPRRFRRYIQKLCRHER